ncbi:hypothetical protein C8P68_11234 [Mucilaginibacter yixingensis]|uniref:Uncharacterized protein n=1 Tax=Mucilaginibacter yixingensis TaxID=1295612 RepID=A0A2T5J4U2_9SPHI|nr:hypothetical protein [Mucilaginibacter yixingensis]PTQ92434.1 hypothetical protein C8P68_11234 [Mucilaginibacter yixingensis]
MKTLIFFVITTVVSYGVMMSAIYKGTDMDIVKHGVIAFTIWGVCLVYLNRRMRKRSPREENEQMLNVYLRDRLKRRL